jgi:nucleoside-diphosphate-sugar epimerase
MKVLLTGSSGFIGGELKRALAGQGHEVYCLNRTASGEEREIVWDFSSRLPASLKNDGQLEMRGELPAHIDAVIHVAAKASFKSIFDCELYDVNAVATAQLAAWARRASALFVFASMAGLHGHASFIDRNTVVEPQNHYAMSKYIAEQQIKMVLDDYVILRIGGVYGLDGPAHLGLNRAITAAYHHGEVPVLAGSGDIKRNYISVVDCVRWILSFLNERENGGAKGPRTVYIAGTEVLTMRQYLGAVTEILTTAPVPMIKEGADGSDSIIEADEPPFPLTTFVDYLQGLSNERQAHNDRLASSSARVEC